MKLSLNKNPVLIQVVGLCPLLAVSVTLIKGLAIGLIVTLALVLTMCTVSGFRNFIPANIRMPILLLISTTFITIIHLFTQTFYYELSLEFGIYIPIIAVNCFLISRLDEVALCQSVSKVLQDSLITGLGIVVIVTVLGTFRELLAYGSLLSQSELLFGPSTQGFTINLLSGESGLTIIAMAPGAFIGLGLLIAMKNYIGNRQISAVEAVEIPTQQSRKQ